MALPRHLFYEKMMLQRQGTITHPSTSSDTGMATIMNTSVNVKLLCFGEGLSRDHVIRGVDVRLCFSNVHLQEVVSVLCITVSNDCALVYCAQELSSTSTS